VAEAHKHKVLLATTPYAQAYTNSKLVHCHYRILERRYLASSSATLPDPINTNHLIPLNYAQNIIAARKADMAKTECYVSVDHQIAGLQAQLEGQQKPLSDIYIAMHSFFLILNLRDNTRVLVQFLALS
jgi:hypothetical protein